MQETKILHKGKLDFDYFSIYIGNESKRLIDKALENKAQEVWHEIKKDAESKGLKPWDGRYYRLENLKDVEKGSKKLVLTDSIKYSQLRAFQKLKVSENYSIDYHTLHISTIGFVETKDNHLVFGYREHTLNNSSYTFIGGGLQSDEIKVKSSQDIRLNILKEMTEEINTSEDEIEDLYLIGFVHAIERMNFYFFFYSLLNLTKQELKDRFHEGSEHDSLVFVERDKLSEFVRDKPDYMKVCSELLD